MLVVTIIVTMSLETYPKTFTFLKGLTDIPRPYDDAATPGLLALPFYIL